MKSARYRLEHHALVHPGPFEDFTLYFHAPTPSAASRIALDFADRLNCVLDFVDAHLCIATQITPALLADPDYADTDPDISHPTRATHLRAHYPFAIGRGTQPLKYG